MSSRSNGQVVCQTWAAGTVPVIPRFRNSFHVIVSRLNYLMGGGILCLDVIIYHCHLPKIVLVDIVQKAKYRGGRVLVVALWEGLIIVSNLASRRI